MSRATSALARSMREGATSRAYMLFEKSSTMTTSRLVAGMSLVPRPYWGRASGDEGERGGEDDGHALPGAPSGRSRGHELADPIGIAEAAARAAKADATPNEEAGDDQREERAEEPEGMRELHGNLRMTQARKSASSATSATPGRRSSGKRSSNEAVEASKRVFSSRLRTSCMLAVSA